MTAVLRVLLPAVLALLLAGCQLRIGVDVAVEPRGSGVLAVTVGADEELLARAADAGADPLAVLAERGRRLEEHGWQVIDIAEDGGRSVRLAAGFTSPAEFDALASDLAEALAAPEVRMFEPFRLELTEDRIAVRGSAGLQPTGALVEPGVPASEVVRLAAEERAILYEVRVQLPGEVLDANAARREDGVLVWTVAPGERVEVLAVGTRPRPLLPLAAGLLAVIACLLAGVVLLRLRRPRRRAPVRTGG